MSADKVKTIAVCGQVCLYLFNSACSSIVYPNLVGRNINFFGIRFLESQISHQNPSEAENESTFLKIEIPKINLIGFHKSGSQ